MSVQEDRLALYELHGVDRTYGGGSQAVHAVSDVDLAVDAGDRLGIVGDSGSGKSPHPRRDPLSWHRHRLAAGQAHG